MKCRLITEGSRPGPEEKSILVETGEVLCGEARAFASERGPVRRREKNTIGAQQPDELAQPGILRRLIQMSEHRDTDDDIEELGPMPRGWCRRDLLPLSGEVAAKPLDVSGVDIDAVKRRHARVRLEMPGDAPAAAAEIQPAFRPRISGLHILEHGEEISCGFATDRQNS